MLRCSERTFASCDGEIGVLFASEHISVKEEGKAFDLLDERVIREGTKKGLI